MREAGGVGQTTWKLGGICYYAPDTNWVNCQQIPGMVKLVYLSMKDAYPSDDGQSEIKKPEGGRYDPNINHGQESKDQSPH